MSLFTPEERERLREALIAAARADEDIVGAAHTGSFALGRADRWSDIDMALAAAPAADIPRLVSRWTARMYADHGAAAHHDVWRGSTLFRVFLLRSTLQVDIAFGTAAEFGPLGPAFRLVFGMDARRQSPASPAAGEFIGMAWLYALHARSSAARGRRWQAAYMINGMRDQVMSLACLRHGVAPHQGRGLDDLPAGVATEFERTLMRSLDEDEMQRAFVATIEALEREAALADAALAHRLATPLALLREPPERT